MNIRVLGINNIVGETMTETQTIDWGGLVTAVINAVVTGLRSVADFISANAGWIVSAFLGIAVAVAVVRYARRIGVGRLFDFIGRLLR